MSAKSNSVADAPVESSWSNRRLVQDCLAGRPQAWEALIHRYKNLIYSIPLKQGLSPDDATEVFQWVCVSLLSELPRLRDPQALPAWLIRVTLNRCLSQQRAQRQFVEMHGELDGSPSLCEPPKSLDDLIHEAELEQSLRDALASLPPRCRRLIAMLFFEMPVKPYDEVATSLGLARGSIGFIRARCLDRLRKKLEQTGFTGQ